MTESSDGAAGFTRLSRTGSAGSLASSDTGISEVLSDDGTTSPKHLRLLSSHSPSFEAIRGAFNHYYNSDDFTKPEKIASGFFGDVFKVREKQTGELMVLKKSRDGQPSLIQEVELLQKLSAPTPHPNILKLLGACCDHGRVYPLTEHVNRGSLESLLLGEEQLFWAQRKNIALGIALGMQFLHRKGYFHRDLTAKNVLVRDDSEAAELHRRYTAIVADFGLATRIPDKQHTSSGLRIVGSPWWMAPECLRGDRFYTSKVDVFSYGITLFQIYARVDADPDFLPRNNHFGVDYVALCHDHPPNIPLAMQLLRTAIDCSKVRPTERPEFASICRSLQEPPPERRAFTRLPSSQSAPNIPGVLLRAMTLADPFYAPSLANPFATLDEQFKDGKKIIGSMSEGFFEPHWSPSLSSNLMNPLRLDWQLPNSRLSREGTSSVAPIISYYEMLSESRRTGTSDRQRRRLFHLLNPSRGHTLSPRGSTGSSENTTVAEDATL